MARSGRAEDPTCMVEVVVACCPLSVRLALASHPSLALIASALDSWMWLSKRPAPPMSAPPWRGKRWSKTEPSGSIAQCLRGIRIAPPLAWIWMLDTSVRHPHRSPHYHVVACSFILQSTHGVTAILDQNNTSHLGSDGLHGSVRLGLFFARDVASASA